MEGGADGHKGGKDQIGNRRRVTVCEFRWGEDSIKESGKKLISEMVSDVPGYSSRSKHSDRRMNHRVGYILEVLIPHITVSVRTGREGLGADNPSSSKIQCTPLGVFHRRERGNHRSQGFTVRKHDRVVVPVVEAILVPGEVIPGILLMGGHRVMQDGREIPRARARSTEER